MGRPDRTAAALRAVRLTPALTIDEAGAYAGVSGRKLRAALGRLGHRGVCAQQATALTRASHPAARALGAIHQACPPQTAAQAAADTSAHTAVALSGLRAMSARPRLETLTEDESAALARHGDCSPRELDGLAHSANVETRKAVAERGDCPPQTLRRLVHDHDEEVSYEAQIGATRRSPALLAELVGDPKSRWRPYLLGNAGCPGALLARAARYHFDWWSLSDVASHPNCPQTLLQTLSDHHSEVVRAEVAKRVDCPPETVRRLAGDDVARVRAAVAERGDCTPRLLEQLADTDDGAVLRSVAENPSCPPPLLRQLASDDDKQLREAVARNINCPVDVMEQLSEKGGPWSSLATNTGCPPNIQTKHIADSDPWRLTTIAAHPSCEPHVLQAIADTTSPEAEDPEQLYVTLAGHPNSPPAVLENLADGFSEHFTELREALATNPSCPTRVLTKLAEDGHPSVWAAAIANLKNRRDTIR